MEDVHLVHVAQAFTDLPDEHHRVELRQLVVLIDDSVEEFTSINTVQRSAQNIIRNIKLINLYYYKGKVKEKVGSS